MIFFVHGGPSPFLHLSSKAPGIVCIRRTRERWSHADQMAAAWSEVGAAIAERFGEATRVLVDIRDSPPHNGEHFEAVVVPRIQSVVTQFQRAAICVSSQIGKLQIRRHTEGWISPSVPLQSLAIFDDESQSMAFLKGNHGTYSI